MRSLSATVAGLLLASISWGQFTPGNIIASQARIGPNQYTFSEYRTTGAFVRRVSIPRMAGQDFTDSNRGMVVDYHGRLHVFNGTSNNVHLSTYDPLTSSWSHLAIPGLSSGSNTMSGKIAAYHDYVFLPDHGSNPGIVRVDTRTNTWLRFAIPSSSNDSSVDLNIGPDGLLYSLDGAGSPSGTELNIYNPETLTLVRSNVLLWFIAPRGMSSLRNVVPRYDGNMWFNDQRSPVYLVSPDITELASRTFTQTGNIHDFDIADDGSLMQIQSNGRVYIYDSDFVRTSSFPTSGDASSASFGTFVPEFNVNVWPSSVSLFRGLQTGGGLSDLLISDDSSFNAKAHITLNPFESPLQIIVTGNSPIETPSELRFKLEAKVNTPGLTQTLSMFNYLTGLYEEVDFWIGSPTDSIVEVSITTNPSRFIQVGTGEMKARVSYKQTGIALTWPWATEIDHAIWKVIP